MVQRAEPSNNSYCTVLGKELGVPQNAVCLIPATEHALKLERERFSRRKPGVTIRTKDIYHKRCGGDSEIALPGRHRAGLPAAPMLQCPCFTTPFARSFQPGIICPKCYLQLVCFTAKIGKRKNTVLERILRKSGGENDRLERLLLLGG